MNDTLTRLLKFAKLHAANGERVFGNRHGPPLHESSRMGR
jgi:hypothetical protein